MERASVGDDVSAHLACDLAKSVQVGGKFLVFIWTKCLGIFEKSVHGPAVEVEEFPHLGVRDSARAVRLNDEGLKGMARKLMRLCPKSLYERVRQRDFDCRSHTTKLARYASACRFGMRAQAPAVGCAVLSTRWLDIARHHFSGLSCSRLWICCAYADLRVSLRKVRKRQRTVGSFQQMEGNQVSALRIDQARQTPVCVRVGCEWR
jgi:hypothetical protein